MSLKLHHLRDLLAVVEKGSINAAARHLGISQPSISRSLRDLEKEVGAPLLERHVRGAVLTTFGVMYARRAGIAIGELRRGREEIQQVQGQVQGSVTACLSGVVHVTLLPEVLRTFGERYAGVQLHIVEGRYPSAEAHLKDGSYDFYVGPPPEDGATAPELQVRKLFSNPRMVLARKGHPLGKARTLAELGDVRWVTTHITSHDEAELGGLFSSRGLPLPRLALRADSALTWITAVASTDMMSISPRLYLNFPLVEQLLAPVPIKEALAGPAVSLIRRAAVPPTPAAEYLCDLLCRAAAPYLARRSG